MWTAVNNDQHFIDVRLANSVFQLVPLLTDAEICQYLELLCYYSGQLEQNYAKTAPADFFSRLFKAIYGIITDGPLSARVLIAFRRCLRVVKEISDDDLVKVIDAMLPFETDGVNNVEQLAIVRVAVSKFNNFQWSQKQFEQIQKYFAGLDVKQVRVIKSAPKLLSKTP